MDDLFVCIPSLELFELHDFWLVAKLLPGGKIITWRYYRFIEGFEVLTGYLILLLLLLLVIITIMIIFIIIIFPNNPRISPKV